MRDKLAQKPHPRVFALRGELGFRWVILSSLHPFSVSPLSSPVDGARSCPPSRRSTYKMQFYREEEEREEEEEEEGNERGELS